MADNAAKLQIKPGVTIWTSDRNLFERVGPLPDGVQFVESPPAAEVAVVFGSSAAIVRGELDTHSTPLLKVPAFWIAYPKAGQADINRDTLWPILAEYGFRPNSQIAIDETWSALRFRALAPGEVFDRARKR